MYSCLFSFFLSFFLYRALKKNSNVRKKDEKKSRDDDDATIGVEKKERKEGRKKERNVVQTKAQRETASIWLGLDRRYHRRLRSANERCRQRRTRREKKERIDVENPPNSLGEESVYFRFDVQEESDGPKTVRLSGERKDCRSGFDIEMEETWVRDLMFFAVHTKECDEFWNDEYLPSTHSATKRASEINPERENRLHFVLFWRWNNGRTHLVEHELIGENHNESKRREEESGRSRHRKRRGRRSRSGQENSGDEGKVSEG